MKRSLAAADFDVRLLEVDVAVAGRAVSLVRRQVAPDVENRLKRNSFIEFIYGFRGDKTGTSQDNFQKILLIKMQ